MRPERRRERRFSRVPPSPRIPVLEALETGVLVADGAMGTMLYERGIFINRCFDELNLSAPALVEEVHRQYVEAGADIIETNTFGANRLRLAAHGLSGRVAEINRAGARLARQSGSDRAYVAGSIGPLGVRIEPWGPTSLEEARQAFAEQAQSLADAGVDLFYLETFASLSELEQAVAGVRSVSRLPIVAHLTVGDEGLSLEGTPVEDFAPRIESWGVEALGLNCGVGPQGMLEAIERMAAVTRARLSAMPNAGLPRHIEGRNIYLCSPDYMASYARRFLQAGVRLVGGCCGTTPQHIRAIKETVRSRASAGPARRAATRRRRSEAAAGAPWVAPLAERSKLGAALARGEFVTAVSLPPPRGWDVDEVAEAARSLHEVGVTCVDVPEEQRGAARLSPLALAVLLKGRVGIEALLHYVCHDRHLPAMQSDLLGAHALGLRNILILTGDPGLFGDSTEATGAREVDAIGLTNVVRKLNEGLDPGGNRIGLPTSFCIGVGANPAALDLDLEVRRFRYKVEAGADFAVTPPVFDPAAVERFLDRVSGFRIPIVAGVWPLASARQAEFLGNEVPGMSVPGPILERMRRARTDEQARREGITIARETLERLRPLVQGAQVRVGPGRPADALAVLHGVVL
jgi:homocysteine S-methyltransferase